MKKTTFFALGLFLSSAFMAVGSEQKSTPSEEKISSAIETKQKVFNLFAASYASKTLPPF